MDTRYHIHLESRPYMGHEVKPKCHTMPEAVGEASRLHMLFNGDKSVSVWDNDSMCYILDYPGKRAAL